MARHTRLPPANSHLHLHPLCRPRDLALSPRAPSFCLPRSFRSAPLRAVPACLWPACRHSMRASSKATPNSAASSAYAESANLRPTWDPSSLRLLCHHRLGRGAWMRPRMRWESIISPLDAGWSQPQLFGWASVAATGGRFLSVWCLRVASPQLGCLNPLSSVPDDAHWGAAIQTRALTTCLLYYSTVRKCAADGRAHDQGRLHRDAFSALLLLA